jgi:predicted nucleic acid-binding protein
LDLYSDLETEARKRLDAREPDDWPIRAAALALGCPIWTEDAGLLRLSRRNVDVRQHRQLPGAIALAFRSCSRRLAECTGAVDI